MHVRAGSIKKTWTLHEQKRWRHGGKRSEADRVLNQQFIPSHFDFFLSDLTDHSAACLLLCLDRHLGLKIIARLTSLDPSVSRHAGGMRVNEPTLSQHRGPLWCDGVRLIPRLWYQVRGRCARYSSLTYWKHVHSVFFVRHSNSVVCWSVCQMWE